MQNSGTSRAAQSKTFVLSTAVRCPELNNNSTKPRFYALFTQSLNPSGHKPEGLSPIKDYLMETMTFMQYTHKC